MKRGITLILVLWMVFCITACGKQTESSTGNEQEPVSMVEEENSQTNSLDGEIADRLSNFSVGSCELSLPCTVGEFMNHFELEYAYPVPEVYDAMCCSYLIDEESAGVIMVYTEDEEVHDTDYVYSILLDGISFIKEDSFAFEVSGITEDMTREQIEEIWGEPSRSSDMTMIYSDGEADDSNEIVFFVDETSGKITGIIFSVRLDRIKELKSSEES